VKEMSEIKQAQSSITTNSQTSAANTSIVEPLLTSQDGPSENQ
jgi:hypothetical protein